MDISVLSKSLKFKYLILLENLKLIHRMENNKNLF
jgi:hypothetical protein